MSFRLVKVLRTAPSWRPRKGGHVDLLLRVPVDDFDTLQRLAQIGRNETFSLTLQRVFLCTRCGSELEISRDQDAAIMFGDQVCDECHAEMKQKLTDDAQNPNVKSALIEVEEVIVAPIGTQPATKIIRIAESGPPPKVTVGTPENSMTWPAKTVKAPVDPDGIASTKQSACGYFDTKDLSKWCELRAMHKVPHSLKEPPK